MGIIIHGARQIWLNRNNAWAGKDMEDPVEAATRVRNGGINRGGELNKFIITDINEGDHWELPPPGVTKLNVDGSWAGMKYPAGVAVCARDENGLVICTEAKWLENINSCEEAEAISLSMAMELAAKRKFHRVIFELDNATVMERVIKGTKHESAFGSHIRKCRTLLNIHPFWSLRLVLREANSVADALAGKARTERWSWNKSIAIPFSLAGLI